MSLKIPVEPLTAEAFAPFGDVIEAAGAPDVVINRGSCGRYHDRAELDFAAGRAGISLFKAEPRPLPYTLEMVERHPEGSQAFVPMSLEPFLVIVAPDNSSQPGRPRAFKTTPGQAVNYRRGTWHGVLTPLRAPGLFAVIDRIGDGTNLQEHWFDQAFTVVPGEVQAGD